MILLFEQHSLTTKTACWLIAWVLAILTFSPLAFASSTSNCPPETWPQQEQSRWHYSKTDNPKAVLLATHGLNQRSSSLQALIDVFTEQGVDTYRLSLPGHRGECHKHLIEVEPKDFEDAFLNAYRQARRRADQLDVPLYFFGYSTGSLLGFVIPAHHEGVKFARSIHIAPAIQLRFYSHFIRLLFPFTDMIPSRSPEPYRAHQNGTAVALYKAFFHHYERIEQLKAADFDHPALIFIHPWDELISPSGIQQMQQDMNLQKWKIVELKKPQAPLSDYAHLMVDPETMPATTWEQLKSEIRAFVAATSPGANAIN